MTNLELVKKLERRIRNQRRALRENWEIVEMRAGHKVMPKEVRSRMLTHWSAASREVKALRAKNERLTAALREAHRAGFRAWWGPANDTEYNEGIKEEQKAWEQWSAPVPPQDSDSR